MCPFGMKLEENGTIRFVKFTRFFTMFLKKSEHQQFIFLTKHYLLLKF